MNLAEKVAGAYLRLNGFLALPQFTIFEGEWHNHIDLVAMRAANSEEVVNGVRLITDDRLFEGCSEVMGRNARSVNFGLAAEVRTNNRRDAVENDQLAYVRRFLGDIPVIRISFYEGEQPVTSVNQVLCVGVRYAATWIQRRIDWMEEQQIGLSKEGSWNWSEDFLSDFLTLRRYGLLSA